MRFALQAWQIHKPCQAGIVKLIVQCFRATWPVSCQYTTSKIHTPLANHPIHCNYTGYLLQLSYIWVVNVTIVMRTIYCTAQPHNASLLLATEVGIKYLLWKRLLQERVCFVFTWLTGYQPLLWLGGPVEYFHKNDNVLPTMNTIPDLFSFPNHCQMFSTLWSSTL